MKKIVNASAEASILSNHNLEKIKNKMGNYKLSDTYTTYNEALKNIIPEYQRKYINSPSFVFLCQMLKKYCEDENLQENRQALKIAKENFESYCEKMEKINE